MICWMEKMEVLRGWSSRSVMFGCWVVIVRFGELQHSLGSVEVAGGLNVGPCQADS